MKKVFLLLCVLCAFTVSSYAQIDSTFVDSTLTELSDSAKFTKDEVITIVKQFTDFAIEQAEKTPDTKNPMEWIGWGIAALLALVASIRELFFNKKKE